MRSMENLTVTPQSGEPVFRELSREESEALLSRNYVGRLAFSLENWVDIRPLHYVYQDGWIFGRTAPGEKLQVLRHHMWVAFEVDEISGMLDWESAIARGTFYVLRDEGSEHDLRLHRRGLEAVRKLFPNALTDLDELPFRNELFGISIDSLTGRSCSTKANS